MLSDAEPVSCTTCADAVRLRPRCSQAQADPVLAIGGDRRRRQPTARGTP